MVAIRVAHTVCVQYSLRKVIERGPKSLLCTLKTMNSLVFFADELIEIWEILLEGLVSALTASTVHRHRQRKLCPFGSRDFYK